MELIYDHPFASIELTGEFEKQKSPFYKKVSAVYVHLLARSRMDN